MRIKRYRSVRVDGCVYSSVTVKMDVGSEMPTGELAARGQLRASFKYGGLALPCRVYPGAAAAPYGEECILFYPVSNFSRAVIEIWDAVNSQERAQVKVNGGLIKWESRLNRRISKAWVNQLLSRSWTPIPGVLSIGSWAYYQGDNGNAVWRVAVERERKQGAEYAPASWKVLCVDDRGGILCDSAFYLEGQRGVEIGESIVDRDIFSVCLDESCERFTLVVFNEFNPAESNFYRVTSAEAASLKVRYWEETKDACASDETYRAWLENVRPAEGELRAQASVEFCAAPKFSIVVPCFNSNEGFLREMISSVVAQSYVDWELLLLDASADQPTVARVVAEFDDERIRYCELSENAGIVGNTNVGIELATGSHIAFLDHDDTLEPDALFRYAAAISETGAKVLYCDEDSFHVGGDYGQPSFKSDFNRDLLYCHNYVTHFLVVEKALIGKIGVCAEDVSGAQDYDLVLRALAAGFEPYHVPHVLYHWRIHGGSSNDGNVGSKPYAVEAGRLALQRHFDSLGIAGQVEALPAPFTYRMHYLLPEPNPLVSVVIPTCDQAKMLEACVESLFRCTYQNIEVILVENNSSEAQTEEMYAALQQRHPERVNVVRWDKGFNYSALINFGATFAKGEYLLLLNNDTEVISPDFIEEMLGYLQRPEVGVVGAKLYFKDGLVQHAGMLVGPYDALVHVHQFFPSYRAGYLARAIRPGNFSAVTGACQMVKRSVFDEVGGYDEQFAVGFNDADFCLRIREAGYSVVFTPYAELYHYEFVSRGREVVNGEKQLRWKNEQALFMAKWPEYFSGRDPFSNPNLKRDNLYFALGE